MVSGMDPVILITVIFGLHTVGWFYWRFRQPYVITRLTIFASIAYMVHHLIRVYDLTDNNLRASSIGLVIATILTIGSLFMVKAAFALTVFTGAYIIVPDWHSYPIVLVVLFVVSAVIFALAWFFVIIPAMEFCFNTLVTSTILVTGIIAIYEKRFSDSDALDTSADRYWVYALILFVVTLRVVFVWAVEKTLNNTYEELAETELNRF